jgi:hypothetical protein
VRALLGLVVIVTACRPAPPVSPFTLRVAVSGPLEPLSPDREMRSWSQVVLGLVFQPLVTLRPTGEMTPALASQTEAVGSRVKLKLRDGARFSDGQTVTFVDIAESLRRADLEASQEGEAIVVGSKSSHLPIELSLSRALIYRRSASGVVGTGAFVVEEQDAAHVLLRRLAPAQGLIGRVRLDSYPTQQDAFAHTLKGDADFLPEVAPRWVELFEGVPRLHILRAPGSAANMIAFNQAKIPRAERNRLVSALSSDEIRRLAFGEDCVPPSHRPESEPLSPGRPLDVVAVPFLDRFAGAVRRALGPRAGTVKTLEVPEFLGQVRSSSFDLATFRPRVKPAVIAALNWRTGAEGNLSHYSNATVDAAIDRRDWAAVQRALDDDPPGVVVCTPPAIVVVDSRIKTPPLESGGFMDSLPQWEVQQ